MLSVRISSCRVRSIHASVTYAHAQHVCKGLFGAKIMKNPSDRKSHTWTPLKTSTQEKNFWNFYICILKARLKVYT
jgi:hypothetical protein